MVSRALRTEGKRKPKFQSIAEEMGCDKVGEPSQRIEGLRKATERSLPCSHIVLYDDTRPIFEDSSRKIPSARKILILERRSRSSLASKRKKANVAERLLSQTTTYIRPSGLIFDVSFSSIHLTLRKSHYHFLRQRAHIKVLPRMILCANASFCSHLIFITHNPTIEPPSQRLSVFPTMSIM